MDTQYKKMLMEFVEKRMIPPEYSVFIAIKGEYKGRIIIPIYNGDDIVYFQGRSIHDDVFLKFKNPETEKSDIIMNIDKFKNDKYIIVTEGVIDAMMVEDFQGTCVLGGSVSEEFLSRVYKCTDKGVILAVDNDERGEKERNKISEKSKYGKTLKYYVTPNDIKDLNKLKTTYKNIHIYETVVNNCIDYSTLSVRQKI
jgi:5S rRNA maturation endonuclease (ribonuclease M5)